MTTPNWQHHSKKEAKRTLKPQALRQAKKRRSALKAKLLAASVVAVGFTTPVKAHAITWKEFWEPFKPDEVHYHYERPRRRERVIIEHHYERPRRKERVIIEHHYHESRHKQLHYHPHSGIMHKHNHKHGHVHNHYYHH